MNDDHSVLRFSSPGKRRTEGLPLPSSSITDTHETAAAPVANIEVKEEGRSEAEEAGEKKKRPIGDSSGRFVLIHLSGTVIQSSI
ncbi:MAG: hypothetical protein O7G85_05110 [Planctomycetota bacterium]|nr:hypothetical protein [Planctomycetota bacterium]